MLQLSRVVANGEGIVAYIGPLERGRGGRWKSVRRQGRLLGIAVKGDKEKSVGAEKNQR